MSGFWIGDEWEDGSMDKRILKMNHHIPFVPANIGDREAHVHCPHCYQDLCPHYIDEKHDWKFYCHYCKEYFPLPTDKFRWERRHPDIVEKEKK